LENGWSVRPNLDFETGIDLSYLNHKPAGKFGFVKAEGEDLVFPDGDPTRFFGINIQAYSLFIQDRETIKRHASRLSQLGINLVRLHHHDSASWVTPSLIKDGKTTQEINLTSLDTYHWWIKCLKEQGIYVWVDLQVDRPWKEGDSIPGWSTDFAVSNGLATSKGLIYLNQRMIDLSKKFNEQLLLTNNPYTGLKLIDEPAVIGVTITNENDLTSHFGHLLNDKNKNPFHHGLFKKRINQFKKRTPFFQWQLNKTWEQGPAKIFLNDLEARFNLEMISHLRSIGLKVPISTTSLWSDAASLSSIPALSTGDLIDAHAYSGNNPLMANPHLEPSLVSWLAFGQVAGKPFTVTEYNSDIASAEDSAHHILPFVSAHAALQGWDAIMLYGYSQDGFSERNFSPWSSYLNPSVMDLLPATALLYRQRHVSESVKPKTLNDLEKKIFYQDISPKTSSAIRSLSEQSQLKVTLPTNKYLGWLRASPRQPDSEVIQDLDTIYLKPQQSSIISDTGELSRNWQYGEFKIDSPKTQGSINARANSRINLKTVSYTLLQDGTSVIFSSLDKELAVSDKILLTTVSQVRSRKKGLKTEVLSKQVAGSFRLTSKTPNLTIDALNNTEDMTIEMTSTQSGSDFLYTFDLPSTSTASLYLISKKPSQP